MNTRPVPHPARDRFDHGGMSDYIVHNPNRAEVVYTEQGHILPGHTSGQGSTGDKVTARLLRSGLLIRPATKPKPAFTPAPARSKKATKNEEDTQP